MSTNEQIVFKCDPREFRNPELWKEYTAVSKDTTKQEGRAPQASLPVFPLGFWELLIWTAVRVTLTWLLSLHPITSEPRHLQMLALKAQFPFVTTCFTF